MFHRTGQRCEQNARAFRSRSRRPPAGRQGARCWVDPSEPVRGSRTRNPPVDRGSVRVFRGAGACLGGSRRLLQPAGRRECPSGRRSRRSTGPCSAGVASDSGEGCPTAAAIRERVGMSVGRQGLNRIPKVLLGYRWCHCTWFFSATLAWSCRAGISASARTGRWTCRAPPVDLDQRIGLPAGESRQRRRKSTPARLPGLVHLHSITHCTRGWAHGSSRRRRSIEPSWDLLIVQPLCQDLQLSRGGLANGT